LIRVGGAYAFLVAYAASLGGKKTVFIILLESSQHPLFLGQNMALWQLRKGGAMSVAFFFFSSPRK
jgi:hypothetical protein